MVTRTMITGTGSFLPEKVLTNADLEKMVDTTDEWFIARSGIRERRMASPEHATSDLATEAGKNALEMAGIQAHELDLIIVATLSPDHFFPSTAGLVQRNLGAIEAAAFDLEAACTGAKVHRGIPCAPGREGLWASDKLARCVDAYAIPRSEF